MRTTLLELVGLVLIVAAAYVWGGLACALAIAGACCLFASWTITRATRAQVRRR